MADKIEDEGKEHIVFDVPLNQRPLKHNESSNGFYVKKLKQLSFTQCNEELLTNVFKLMKIAEIDEVHLDVRLSL